MESSAGGKPAGGILVTLIAFFLGGALAIQAQLNGALTQRTGSAVLVTLVSFASGTVILAVMAVIRCELPTRAELHVWRWRRWWLFNGPLGAFLVLAISTGVPRLGVALVTVLTVAGQTVTGIALDSRGTGVATRLRVSSRRATAVVVVLVGLAVTVFAMPVNSSTGNFAMMAMILVLVAAGVAAALQQAANGAIAGVSGRAVFAALTSFSGGLFVLLLTAGALWATGGLKSAAWPTAPAEWWLYFGGLFGVLFVVTAAWAVRQIGVLALSLAVVAGQIVTAVALDLITGSVSLSLATGISMIAVLVATVLTVASPQPRSGNGVQREEFS